MELIAPQVGGVASSDGEWIEADQRIDGGPSVLYDAVAVLLTQESATVLCNNTSAVDFLSDAYPHCKYIGFVSGALPLLRRCNIAENGEGIVELADARAIKAFLKSCGELRVWSRETEYSAAVP